MTAAEVSSGDGDAILAVIVAAATTAATAEGLDHRAAHRLAAAINMAMYKDELRNYLKSVICQVAI